MKKRIIIVLIGLYLTCVVLIAEAHSNSQAGILQANPAGGNLIGGDSFGWCIDEGNHMNGTSMTYSLSSSDSYVINYYSEIVNGAAKWSGTVSFTLLTNGNGVGKISTYYAPGTGNYAMFTNPVSDSNGHLISWEIIINRAYPITAVTMAHEFGHVIGLNDLSSPLRLMCGNEQARTATSPTLLDKWGARVITGVHTTHTWGYKYYMTNASGNMHVKYCTQCNGLTYDIGQCVYQNGICLICNTPQGTPPVFSVDDPE